MQYPNVLFRTDLGGVKLTMGQAIKVKRLNGGRRAWPDLFIAACRGGYAGLFIELKNTNIYRKDGTLLKNEHLSEQAKMLDSLKQAGYQTTFAVGFAGAKDAIDTYLSS